MGEKPSAFTEEPTPELRFVERNGKRILQQAFRWRSLDGKAGGGEWKDVPCVPDAAD